MNTQAANIADLPAANQAPAQKWELVRWGNGYTDCFISFEVVGGGTIHITVIGNYKPLSQFRHGNTIPVSKFEARTIWSSLIADGFSRDDC